MKSMKGIERIWPAMVSYSSSVNGGWRKKRARLWCTRMAWKGAVLWPCAGRERHAAAVLAMAVEGRGRR